MNKYRIKQDHKFDLFDAQARLDMICGAKKNDIHSNTWHFLDSKKRSFKIDFSDLEQLEKKYQNSALFETFETILLSKHMWLASVQYYKPVSYEVRLRGIKLFWNMVAKNQLFEITKNELPLVTEFYLRYRWQRGHLIEYHTIKSPDILNMELRLDEWRSALIDFGVNLINHDVTPTRTIKTLKSVVPAVTNHCVTYADWNKGGTRNRLTLDYGKHYVNHCLNLFNSQYPLAKALSRTYKRSSEIRESVNYHFASVNQVMSLTLQGCSLAEIESRCPKWSKTLIRRVFACVTDVFEYEYGVASREAFLMTDKSLVSILQSLKVQPSQNNIDRISVLVWTWIKERDKKSISSLLSGFRQEIHFHDFIYQIELQEEQIDSLGCSIPSVSEYISIGLNPNHGRNLSLTRQLINLVESAGLVAVGALTGWRRSELGFNRLSIIQSVNNDRLDQYSTPFRYQIDWFVPKTNGDVRVLREVTFGTMLIIDRLGSLVGNPEEQPCLYRITPKNESPHDSCLKYLTAVRVMWMHFCYNYRGFDLIEDYHAWRRANKLDKTNESVRKFYEEKFKHSDSKESQIELESNTVDLTLKETWYRVKSGLDRIEFAFTDAKGDKKDWLKRYSEGNLKPEWRRLLDQYLCEDTKNWISSIPKEQLVSAEVSRVVVNELLEDTIYPTPHCLRHMWAEAVYRRFDGDAGWMIRSQFKHISRSMWLAYVRDKDNGSEHRAVKSRVVNSLVYNYLQKNGEGYAGLMHKRLRRLLRKTTVVLPFEQRQLVKEWSDNEIEDIKANPWGYCLIVRRTRGKAKCAELGEPRSHDAAPDLCLGCVHNLMQSENVEWTLFHLASHVEAIKNHQIPKVFKTSSYNLVKQVTRHVKTLDPQHEALDELNSTLDLYENGG